MIDVASITGAITGIKAATEIAKLIKDSFSTLDEAEINFKIAELIGILADAKLEIAEFQEVLICKNKEIKALEEKLEQKESMTFDGGIYWIDGDENPFCPVCFEKENKAHHLSTSAYTEKFWRCKVCKNSFPMHK